MSAAREMVLMSDGSSETTAMTLLKGMLFRYVYLARDYICGGLRVVMCIHDRTTTKTRDCPCAAS